MFFFKEEMVQRHETEQRNHGSRVPWVVAENWVMIDDWLNKSPQERDGIIYIYSLWGVGVSKMISQVNESNLRAQRISRWRSFRFFPTA